MRRKINVPPPANCASYSPSELFRFFFQIGHWTEGSFSDDFQAYTRGTLISTVTINKWKNKDVIPTRYSGQLFKMIETLSEQEIAKAWVTAFETVWALHAARKIPSSPASNANTLSDSICFQHRKWINQLYSEPQSGATFPPADIYVPLQFYETVNENSAIYDADQVLTDNSKTWTFIDGGPGSGKSMSALHMAKTLCQGDIFPIYIRGRNLSGIDIDITNCDQAIIDSFSIKSFLKHFRTSSFQTACLILDGLDEIAPLGYDTTKRLHQTIAELLKETSACSAHNKTLKIIAFGREGHIHFCQNQVPAETSRTLTLLSLDGTQHSGEAINPILEGVDLRPVWWEKYLAATQHVADPSLPDFLCVEYNDFYEFGSDPLLCSLICQTAFHSVGPDTSSKLPHEQVNAFTFAANKNEVFEAIIEFLASDIEPLLTKKSFLSVLQHIALAAWQSGNEQSAAVDTLMGSFNSPNIEAAFEAIGLTPAQHIAPNIILTSFYYRLISQDEKSDKMVVEFTHNNFPEYLISTLFFDRLNLLLSAFENNANIEDALEAWAATSHAGVHTPMLAGFCQNEAALRFDELQNYNWDFILEIIKSHLSAQYFNGTGLNSLTQLQQSSSLLFFLWSCLNLERQKRSGLQFNLDSDSSCFSLADLKRIQPPNSLGYPSGALIEPKLENLSFLAFSLSGMQFSFADLSQLSLSQGHLERSDFQDTSFAMTHWSHVKIDDSQFTRSIFHQTVMNHWQISTSKFTNCLFQGAHFQGALFSECQLKDAFFSQCHFANVEFKTTGFENVVFDRCVFSQSTFTRSKNANRLKGATFRHCTFLDMDAAVRTLFPESLLGTIHPNMSGRKPSSPKKPSIDLTSGNFYL